MLRLILTFTFLLAPSAFACDTHMTKEEARHLISRTGFGASPTEVAKLAGQPREVGVALILDRVAGQTTTPMPSWTKGWGYPYDQIWALGQSQTELFYTNRWLEIEELSAWWLAEMSATSSPLTERLTLFWHDHFASSYDSHENAMWMAQQNQMFRQHAAGNFKDLAHGILKDPAMLSFLSNVENVKSAPNENFGREYLELFTLGEGRGYSQDDVKAAARILTGHRTSYYGERRYFFDQDAHDRGSKTLFDETGRLDTDDLARLALTHPNFGPYIVEKLWNEFVSPTVDSAEIARLTNVWLENDLELRPLLREMFLSDSFWAPENRGTLVKSPVELVIGAVRTFGVEVPDAANLAWVVDEMGQDLFFPPNVGGWPHGVGWLNDASASARATLMSNLMFAIEDGFDAPEQPAMMTTNVTPSPIQAVQANGADLRVGQVFAINTDEYDDWMRAEIVLFDVGYGGKTWRSLPLSLEFNGAENFAELYINPADCTNDCLRTLPKSGDDSQWFAFEPWSGFLDQNPAIDDNDLALVGAIAGHLAEMIETTKDQQTWNDGYNNVDLQRVVHAAQVLAKDTTDLMGAPSGSYVSGFSQADRLGLSSAGETMMSSMFEGYVEAQEAKRRVAIKPNDVWASAEDWFDALPKDQSGIEQAVSMTMALWPTGIDRANANNTYDAAELIRRIVLSPEFQVN